METPTEEEKKIAERLAEEYESNQKEGNAFCVGMIDRKFSKKRITQHIHFILCQRGVIDSQPTASGE